MSRDNKKNNESTSNDRPFTSIVYPVVKVDIRFNFTAMVVTGDAENNKVGVGFGISEVKCPRTNYESFGQNPC